MARVLEPVSNTNTPVRQAIANASNATGMDFGFLMATAHRESSFNPRAEARTSSATGLFQFLDATWLNTLKRHGAKHGLANEANAIETTADGRPFVRDGALRRQLLDLRYEPEISARMAAEYANDNAEFLRARTGQEPQPGDLYAAHFLGPGGASELINAAERQPWARAADLFPSAASANRNIFYEGGRSKSVIEVLEGLRATALKGPSLTAEGAKGGPVTLFRKTDQPQIWLGGINQINNSQDMNAGLLNMLNGGVGANQKNNMPDPMLLAQFYRNSDDANNVQAMEIANISFNGGSIAEVLLPNGEEARAPSAAESFAQLRGRR